MNPDSPPTKKLRLDDTSDHDAGQSERTLPVGQTSPTKSFLARGHPMVLPDEENPPGKLKLDREALSAVIGEDLSPETVAQLELASKGDLERAINIYFDGSWKQRTLANQLRNYGPLQPQIVPKRPSTAAATSSTKRKASGTLVDNAAHDSGAKRYIGSFGIEGWATRSGTNLIAYGQRVNIERQKMQSKPQGAKRAVIKQRRTADIVVRFTNMRGQEIGRLSQNVAAFVSTLIDQKISYFEGTCVYAPDVIRTNDTIFIQLRCYLLRSAFDRPLPSIDDDNRISDLFAPKETEHERDMRLRQVGLVKLFKEVNLEPTEGGGARERHEREALLKVAEDEEKKEVQSSSSQAKKEDGEDGEEEEDGVTLEQDQLDALYRKAQSFDFDSPEAVPSDTFAMDLRRYQKQALYWMLSKETNHSDRENVSMHPLWEKYTWPIKDQDDRTIIPVPELDMDHFYVNLYSGELSLEFPRQEQNCLGGILADEMGLGKTIEMMSLIHTNKADSKLPKEDANGILHPNGTTLVVAPLSLLAQWEAEAKAASKPDTLRTYVYYGNDKKANLKDVLRTHLAPDVIITSYGVVLSEYTQIIRREARGQNMDTGGLFNINFYRIILDEAHHIKNRVSKTARACYELLAHHRWVLTGTPIVNRLEDLFSLVRFLKVDPWQNFSFWKTFITVPFENNEFLRALDVVQTVLEPLVLRRTKDMKTPDGQPLVPLPPKKIIIEKVKLSQEEQDIYDMIQDRIKTSFSRSLEAGTLMKSYTSILAQILRLRQSCCHPNLIRKKNVVEEEMEADAAYDEANGFSDDMDLNDLLDRFSAQQEEDQQGKSANTYGAHVLHQIKAESEQECPFCCSEPMEEQVVTGCWHSACKNCIIDYIEHEKAKPKLPLCVSCRLPINARDLFLVHREPEPSSEITLRRIFTSTNSSKIAALITHLQSLTRTEPATKSCVFSQFTSFLDLIESALIREKIPFARFDGGMTQQERKTVIERFKNHEGRMVLLISLRAGGVGLNLTEARRVFMMDPWWSFAVEAQAIDRVHRMGQVSEVIVHRFVVEGSVEERMVEKIQARKKFIASTLGMMSDEEKKQARIDDIKDLLSD